MNETTILKQIQIAVSKAGHRCFRNNQGFFERDGRKIRTGLGVGSSDLVGWIGGDGPNRGKFLAIEVKRPGGKATEQQIAFIAAVHRAGGVAFICYSVDEALFYLKQATHKPATDSVFKFGELYGK